MSYQREREEFLLRMAGYGMGADVARLILRHATTHQRLSERECNGDDWQIGALVKCPNAKQPLVRQCAECGMVPGTADAADLPTHGKVTRSSVRIAQIERRISELAECAGISLKADFQGDPRGYTVRILVSGFTQGAPTREYGVPVRNP